MEKICLVARRRRDPRFPETETQRRAAMREKVLSAAWTLELPELTEADLEGILIPEALRNIEELISASDEAPQKMSASTASLTLSFEQSQALRALPILANALRKDAAPLICHLVESPEHDRVLLRFSLRAETVPEMMSLKDVCGQLEMSRWSVMRLVREGKLRYHRIANRYIFTADDMRNYLDRMASQQISGRSGT